MTRIKVFTAIVVWLTAAIIAPAAQKVETKNGVRLGSIPLDHFADLIRIQGDRLFILDKLRRMQVHEYRIQ